MSILDTIRAESPEWDVLAVDIADKNDGVLYLIVIRRRVGESGNMILSERYFRYDVEEDSGTYLSNGIERRVTGALGAALRVLYSATTNGDTDPDDPMLMDSRGDGLSYNPEELTEPVETLTDSSIDPDVPVDARSVEEDDPVSLPEPERESWVRCKRCGGTLPEEDAVLFSDGPPLGEIWIHSDGCPEEEDNDDPEVRTDGGRDKRRSPVPVSEERHEVLDSVADIGHDAVDLGGLSPEEVAGALRDAAREIEESDSEVDS